MSDEEKIYTKDKMKQKTVYPTEQTPSYADWALYEMGKDLEDKVDGQSGGAEYTAGSGISISEENVISNTAQPDVTKSYVDGVDVNLQQQIDAIVASSDVKDIVGTYADLQAYDTSTLGNNDIIKVLTDSTHNNATGYYRWVITQDVGAWTYIGSEGPYYTKSEADTLLLDKLNKNFNNADVGQATAGQVLKVNSSANGVEFGNIPEELPSISSGDAGKVLAVNSGETGVEWQSIIVGGGYEYVGNSNSSSNLTPNGSKTTGLQVDIDYDYLIFTIPYNKYSYVSNRYDSGITGVSITYYNKSSSTNTVGVTFYIYRRPKARAINTINVIGSVGYDCMFLPTGGSTGQVYKKTGSDYAQGSWQDIKEVPSISSGDAGKVLTVNSGETGAEWSTPAGGLPAATSSDEGKVLTVDSQGDAAWDDVPKELPAIASGDAGKVLAVNLGETGVEWADVPEELPAISSGDAGKVLAVNSGETCYELINKLDGFTIERHGDSSAFGSGSNSFATFSFGVTFNCNEKDYIVVIFQERDAIGNSGAWTVEGKLFTGQTGNINSLRLRVTGYNDSTIYYSYLVLSRKKKESTSSIYVIGNTSTGILNAFRGGTKGQVLIKQNNNDFKYEWRDISLSNTSDPTSATVGNLGQIFINTTSQDAFICTEADTVTPAYTWKKITLT